MKLEACEDAIEAAEEQMSQEIPKEISLSQPNITSNAEDSGAETSMEDDIGLTNFTIESIQLGQWDKRTQSQTSQKSIVKKKKSICKPKPTLPATYDDLLRYCIQFPQIKAAE